MQQNALDRLKGGLRGMLLFEKSNAKTFISSQQNKIAEGYFILLLKLFFLLKCAVYTKKSYKFFCRAFLQKSDSLFITSFILQYGSFI
jgi:hypothetical protein